MSKLLNSLRQLELRTVAEYEANKKQTARKVREITDSMAKSLRLPACIDLSSFESLAVSSDTVIPQQLRIGYKEIDLNDGPDHVSLPITLDLHEINAAFFDIDDINGTALLQQIGFRLLLSLKPGLCNLFLVDANYGSCYAQLGQIRHPQVKITNVNSSMAVEQMGKDLGKIIVDANQSYKANYANLNAYNSNPDNKPRPYNIVLIEDFPENFNDASLIELKRLINKRNAVNAGIYIFINKSRNNSLEPSSYGLYKVDADSVREVCTCVSYNAEKGVGINGQPIPNAVKTSLDLENVGLGSHVQKLFSGFKTEGPKTKVLDRWIDDLKKSGSIWKENTISGINVPVGIIDSHRKFEFYMGDDSSSSCLDYFALIIGMSGTGKTFFLHTVITQLAMHYSPQELELYLLDFKNGSGFDMYKNLPHARAIMSVNSIEFAYRVLVTLTEEAARRSRLFQRATESCDRQISNLGEYRRYTNEQMPRIVLVMDEFQWLFRSSNYGDRVSDARNLLIEGIRQWRAFGIIVILSTQTMEGVAIGEAMSQINYRFAFTVNSSDSKSMIGNEAASLLGMEKGRCIMHNSMDKSEQMNVELRNVWTDDYSKHISFLADKYRSECGPTLPPRFVCDSFAANIRDNAAIADLKEDQYRCHAYLGIPNILRLSHTRICFERHANSNMLLLGNDTPTAVNLVAMTLTQSLRQSPKESKCYIVDCTPPGDRYENSFAPLEQMSGNFIVGNTDSLAPLTRELDRRKTEATEGRFTKERIFVTVFNVQSAYDLRPQQGTFSMEPSPRAEQLAALIKDGPAFGIHVILHCQNVAEVFGHNAILGENYWQNFENKVFFEGADFKSLPVYNSALSKLGMIPPGTIIVDNNRFDREEFEVCKVYSKIGKDNLTVENINQVFLL